MLQDSLISTQAIRYVLIGISHNLFSYLLYLLVTWLWLDPKLAVTLLYPIGVIVAYFAHAKYSFSFKGRKDKAFIRYLIANIIGYGTNLLLLFFFVDILLFPHQIVQAVAIIVLASLFFLLSKYYVFPHQEVKKY